MAKSISARALAAQTVALIFTSGCSLNTALAKTKNTSLAPQDWQFFQELCYGTTRWYYTLTGITRLLLQKPLKEKDADIQALLLIGFYQLLHLKTPTHAALHATVDAARELQKPWAASLINGVLRQFLRNQANLMLQLQQSADTHYAHQQWFIKQLQNAFPNEWQTILQANNEKPPMAIRVNRLQQSRDAYLKILLESNIAAYPILETQDGILLTTPCDVQQLPGFSTGTVSVQDGAAQLAAQLLELAPAQTVLDACAAPGGKTCHILESEPDLTALIALDADAMRLNKITDNVKRLQLMQDKLAIKLGKAEKPATWWDGQLFDRILLDAPCSATGVIRRHPDIKLLRRASDINQLANTQKTLLENLWSLLKPGGLLLYATCSVLPAENASIIQAFLAQHFDATEEVITANWGLAQASGRQILPKHNGMDGFFYAKLRKSYKN
jgi:16S rRNA (cytosine967-C5)-methyltransferase